MSKTKQERYTPDQIEQALRNSGGFLSGAAKKLKCDWATVNNYIKRYPKLQEALIEIKESMIDLSESKLIGQINEGNITAIIFHLKCLGKNRGYVEKQEVSHEITGKNGGKIEIDDSDSKTAEVLDILFKSGAIKQKVDPIINPEA